MTNKFNFKLTVEQQKLVTDYMYVVDIIVKQLIKGQANSLITKGYSMDDAKQDGYLALCSAANTYDSTRNASFSTYASIVIRNYLYNRIKEHNKYYDTFQNETPAEIVCECNDLYNCETADVMSAIQKRKSIYDDKQPLAYDIFLMKNILGYNHKAIVQKFNISSETVSYKYKLARLDLRRSLPQALLA